MLFLVDYEGDEIFLCVCVFGFFFNPQNRVLVLLPGLWASACDSLSDQVC